MLVDITHGGSRGGVEITESGVKVFCGYGGMAGDQQMTSLQRVQVVGPNGLKGPGIYIHRGTCEGGFQVGPRLEPDSSIFPGVSN